jgi:hypothetical protein
VVWSDEPGDDDSDEGNSDDDTLDEDSSEDGVLGGQDLTQVLPDQLNGLETWIVRHGNPWKHPWKNANLRYMMNNIYRKFAAATDSTSSPDDYLKQGGHYVEVKDLLHQLLKDEVDRHTDIDDEEIQDLFTSYSICCLRLSTMTTHMQEMIVDNKFATKKAVRTIGIHQLY